MDENLYNQVSNASPDRPDGSQTITGDLTFADLRNRDLRQFQLSHVNFSNAILDRSVMYRVVECVFDSASMVGIKVLPGGQIYKSNLCRANLQQVSMTSVNLRECDFTDADMRFGTFDRSMMEDADFNGANV